MDFLRNHQYFLAKKVSMMERQKIMILGAGRDQTAIIKKARQMGFFVIVVSIPGEYPGFLLADKSYEIDVRQKEAVLEIARLEKICGIVTDQLDVSVPTVAYVAEKMKLPGIGYDCALNFTNKYRMRQICTEIGIPVPKYFQAATLDEAKKCANELDFPLVIKPVDSGGSRGVSKVNRLGELEGKFVNALRRSRSKSVIMEEFFSGMEFAVVGFVLDYEYTNLGIGDRYNFTLPDVFVPRRTLFPSLLSRGLQDKIIEMDTRLITRFGPKFGNTYSEYLIDLKTGDVRLVETAIRGCGNFTSSDLVPLACGIDGNELLIAIVSGVTGVKMDKNKRINKASGSVFFHLPDGTICDIRGYNDLRDVPGVYQTYLPDLKVGEKTKTMRDKGDRLGPILIRGENRKELEGVINKIQEKLLIQVQTADGIKGIIW